MSLIKVLKDVSNKRETEAILRSRDNSADLATELASKNAKRIAKLNDSDRKVAKQYMQCYNTIRKGNMVYLIDSKGNQIAKYLLDDINNADEYFRVISKARTKALDVCIDKTSSATGFLFNFEFEQQMTAMSDNEIKDRREIAWHSFKTV